jgi:hypothetical protein
MASKATPNTVTAEVKEFATKAESKAKQAYAKGSAAVSEAVEFSKGNADALVTSGKIVATGLQGLGKTAVAEGKTAMAAAKADFIALKAVATPTALIALQSKIASRNLETAFALGAKNSQTLIKLFDQAFAPLTARADLAVSKFKKAA